MYHALPLLICCIRSPLTDLYIPWGTARFIPTHLQYPPLSSFFLSSSSISTGVMAESIYSDHCSRLGMLIITVLMISTYLLKEPIVLLCSWFILFTMAIVIWSSALITDVSDRGLDFFLFIPSLA